MALLRKKLLATRLMPAEKPIRFRNGQLARSCGIATVRQRPCTADGVMFMTLEEDTGSINVIVWQSVLQRQRREALGSSLLAVYGVWQRESDVKHLMAQRLVDMSHLLGELPTASRNVH